MSVGVRQGEYIATPVDKRQPFNKPSPSYLFALVNSAMLSATPAQRNVLDKLRLSIRPIEMLPSREAVMNSVTDLVFAITQWRTGDATEEQVVELFERMSTKGQNLASDDPSRP
jgi:hypothetical protein